MAKTYRNLAHPFAPVWNGDSRALVLGTFPSVQSREREFYYGHPQNRFWPVLAALFTEDVPETAQQKSALLLSHRIALWDVLASCDVTGSADGSIRSPVPNDIAALLAKAPIRSVFCNGQAAASLYRRFAEPLTGVPAVTLPSTSPANARWTRETLLAAWAPLRVCVK
jgi:double-stranded uracil-DNA glycosylase